MQLRVFIYSHHLSHDIGGFRVISLEVQNAVGLYDDANLKRAKLEAIIDALKTSVDCVCKWMFT